jgi:hypothetical protein
MGDLLQEIAVEEERISETLLALEQALSREERTVVELAAIATFLTELSAYAESARLD